MQARGLKGEGVVRLSWTSFIGIFLIDRTETTRDVSSARDGFAFAFAIGWFYCSLLTVLSFPFPIPVLGTVFLAGRLCFVRVLRLELLTAHAHARHDFGPRPLRSDAGSTSCAQAGCRAAHYARRGAPWRRRVRVGVSVREVCVWVCVRPALRPLWYLLPPKPPGHTHLPTRHLMTNDAQ